MKLKYLTIAVATLATFGYAPAPAISATLEEKDALFLACMEARGYTDAASVICYRAAYGSETSGGGGPGTVDTRIPYTDCRGAEFYCSFPNVRPQ